MVGVYKPQSNELITVFVASLDEEMSIQVITFPNEKFDRSSLTE